MGADRGSSRAVDCCYAFASGLTGKLRCCGRRAPTSVFLRLRTVEGLVLCNN
ncbi:hypothetical protein BU14_2218s0001 [Porphyra umbilicalis]|uniref:Uncharacterized protein n=1 Tax=Porphyra umbilicalis TaxID=2786 RepID=A0A1X6NJU2_PORUM|nr:hypothetical protein BU14_2218s0001 [Porphyra umbilicalis]|eukprot:OSX68810.1 hypothetical protein BU14_2218s0001 [Porphyra umbilicalis]